MKDAVRILELIRESDYGRAFPGRGSPESVRWNRDPFKVLIATVLSQRTRDRNTADAADRLFSRYGDPASIASAPMDEVMELVRPAGFPRAKAKAIREIAGIVDTRYGGEVPGDMESLLALPMVGRKTANCVLAYAFGRDAICVDTHVHRIANRIGLVRAKDPEG
ncbi:MAG: endonuclease III domain-containing protein, partial [Methanomassiliicoccales archaeon]